MNVQDEDATEPFPGGPSRRRLLGKLMAEIRVEFRRDDLVFDATDAVFGGPSCVVRDCVRPARQRGMCLGHRQRWTAAGKLYQLRRGLYALAPPYQGE